jgi:flagellar hook-basal body complex protein FliE
MVAPIIAAKAYAAIQQVAGPEVAGSTGAAAGPNFGQMVTSAIHDAVGQTRNAEAQMAAQAQGKGNLVDVVTSIASAQTSLQTVIAVRDQVIAAYQQIMNMPI